MQVLLTEIIAPTRRDITALNNEILMILNGCLLTFGFWRPTFYQLNYAPVIFLGAKLDGRDEVFLRNDEKVD